MERRAAKIEKGKVVNILVIDDNTPREFYDVELGEDEVVEIGWKHKAGKFIAPKPEAPADGQ